MVDRDHVNPYRVWEKEGMDIHPTEAELERLRGEGILHPAAITEITADGTVTLPVSLMANSLCVVEFTRI